MNRRSILSAAAALAWPIRASAASLPWTMQLLNGSFDGKAYAAGLHVKLVPNWKTYWRIPGAGGVPPSITATGANLKTFAFDCPLPQRLAGPDGESIGYHDEVIFPMRIEPIDADALMAINLDVFIGVCETICVPAAKKFATQFQPASASTAADAIIRDWQIKVPIVQPAGPVQQVTTMEHGGKSALKLQLSTPVDDVFVEGLDRLYFRAPTADGVIIAEGAKSIADLKGAKLRLTIAMNGQGLEQHVTVV